MREGPPSSSVVVGVLLPTWMRVAAGLVLLLLPDGVTLVVWRAGHEPFFNSPDAMCLLIQQGVSLLCRLAALSKAPHDRIVLRLPYNESAYLLSTGGRTFDR